MRAKSGRGEPPINDVVNMIEMNGSACASLRKLGIITRYCAASRSYRAKRSAGFVPGNENG